IGASRCCSVRGRFTWRTPRASMWRKRSYGKRWRFIVRWRRRSALSSERFAFGLIYVAETPLSPALAIDSPDDHRLEQLPRSRFFFLSPFGDASADPVA